MCKVLHICCYHYNLHVFCRCSFYPPLLSHMCSNVRFLPHSFVLSSLVSPSLLCMPVYSSNAPSLQCSFFPCWSVPSLYARLLFKCSFIAMFFLPLFLRPFFVCSPLFKCSFIAMFFVQELIEKAFLERDGENKAMLNYLA